jgi:hypothetical protein
MDGPMDASEIAEVNAVQMALRFGWTLDYIWGMDSTEFYRVVRIVKAIDAAQAYRQGSRG